MTLFERIRKYFGGHVHERKLFLVGGIAFVKCTTCGMESIPWRPPLEAVAAAHTYHENDVQELIAIEKQLKEKTK